MDRHRAKLFSTFPQAAVLDRALATATNRTPFFFMREVDNGDLSGCWYAFGRLGPQLERQFNINGEVLFVFSPWKDFQRRSYNAITQGLFAEVREHQTSTDHTERFTPDRKVVMVATPDPNGEQNIAAWNSEDEGTQVVYVAPTGADELDQRRLLIASLASTLGRRDLYSGKNPVTGGDFFGRTGLLQEISVAIDGDQNTALFGFRRSGKTSVVLELKRRMLPKGTLFSLTDLESVEDMDALPGIIANDVLNCLRTAKSYGHQVWIGSPGEQASAISDYGALSVRLKRVAERNAGLRIVVAIDEVESLTRYIESSPQKARAFLGALRAAAQGSPNISLMFTGVSNRAFAQSTLGAGYDNPVFGSVDTWYLRHFSPPETAALLQALGEPMLLSWNDEALRLVHDLTGGLPYFVRSLGSGVRAESHNVATGPREFGQVIVGGDMVESAARKWSTNAAAEWEQIVASIELHYPGSEELINAASGDEIGEWVRGDEGFSAAADMLTALGLLVQTDGVYARSTSLESLNALGSTNMRKRRRRADLPPQDLIRELIGTGETQSIEFKQTSRINVRTGKKDQAIEDEVVKAVAAFLNSDGGDLLLGVCDNGELYGVDVDIAITRSDDFYQQWLTGSLLAARLTAAAVAQHVRTVHVTVEGKRIVVVRVTPCDEPVWATYDKEERLLVRNGNRTEQLHGADVTRFVVARTKKS